jgi:hypothetical protein
MIKEPEDEAFEAIADRRYPRLRTGIPTLLNVQQLA